MNKGAWELWKTLPRAFPYLRPYRKLMVLSFLITVASAAVALAEPWPLAIIVDNVLGERHVGGPLEFLFDEDVGQYTLLVFAVLAGFFVTFFSHGLTVLSDWNNAKIEQRMVLDLRGDLFNHAQGLSLTFHDQRLTGQLMQQINMQAAAMGVILIAAPPIAQALLMLIGMFVIVMLISWKIGLVSLAAVPFIWWSLGLYGTKIVPRLQLVQSQEWKSLSIVHEAMSMLRVIVSFGRESHEYGRFRSQGEEAVEQRIKLTVRQTLFALAVTSATAIGTSLVLGVGAYEVIQGNITVGELLVLIAYIAAVYQPLEQISTTIGELNDQFVQFNSSLDLLDTPKEVVEAPGAVDIGRSRGRVTFDDLHFAYKGRQDTLKGISFETQPGQRVAVVGPTGAGKTTLISLLIRFYDPKSGSISIDGHDIRNLKLSCLRDQISVVLQEPLLFSGSVADNIRYGKLDATMDEIEAAAKAANAHDFISRLPQGYDTELGERGAQLSGGERQRVSVARAFIKNAPILVLDEPTSSIDSKTEGVILDALEELMEGRTSFMIAHRLSTVRDADLILVLRDGELVEAGTHDELLAHEHGAFRQLYEAQNKPRRRPRTLAGVSTGAVVPPQEEQETEEPAFTGNGGPNGHEPLEEALYGAELGEPEPPGEQPEPEPEPVLLRDPAPPPRERRTKRRLGRMLVVVGVAAFGFAAFMWLADDAGQDRAGLATGALEVKGVEVTELPTGVAVADGNAYVTRARATRLGRVPLDSFDRAYASYNVPANASDIEAAAGALWVTSQRPGRLTKIDLKTDARTDVPLPEGSPIGIVAEGDDTVWVALRNGPRSAVVSLDARDARVRDQFTVQDGITQIASGDGAVWVTNRRRPTITRFGTDGALSTFALSARGAGVAAADGAVAALPSRDEVVRVGGDGDAWRAAVTGRPRAIAESGGTVWVAGFSSSLLSRLDARDGSELGAPVAVATEPTEVEAVGDDVFIVSQREERLERVEVP